MRRGFLRPSPEKEDGDPRHENRNDLRRGKLGERRDAEDVAARIIAQEFDQKPDRRSILIQVFDQKIAFIQRQRFFVETGISRHDGLRRLLLECIHINP